MLIGILENFGRTLADAFRGVRHASRVVAALQAHRRPDPTDLRRLGIEPRAFDSMHQY